MKSNRGVFAQMIKKPSKADGFYFGTEDIFNLKGSEDIVVVGQVIGKLTTGDTVCITNPGDDDTASMTGTVIGIEVNRLEARVAKNTVAALRIKDGRKLPLKTGSVLHTERGTREAIHDVYMMAIGEGFISFKEMKLSQAEFARMSLTDIVELINLFRLYIDKEKGKLAETLSSHDAEISDLLGNVLRDKLLSAKEIYVLMNKKTGEPHMLSVSYESENGEITTTPPDIVVLTKAYIDEWKNKFDGEVFEFLEVENGPSVTVIRDFLGSAFYLNGACGVRVLYENIVAVAESLVARPDYSNLPDIQVPVTNPDLERWLLLTGQLDEPKTTDEEKIQMALYSHLFRELAGARFIIPMKMDSEPDEPDEDGQVTIKKDTKMTISIQSGRGDRDAVRMYTDWKRFRLLYKEEEGWSGLIETIPGMIESFDCAINVTNHPSAGCYVDRIAYDADIRRHVTKDAGACI